MTIDGKNFPNVASEQYASMMKNMSAGKSSLASALSSEEKGTSGSQGWKGDSLHLSEEAVAKLREVNPEVLKRFGYDTDESQTYKSAQEKFFYLQDEYINNPKSVSEVSYDAFMEAIKGVDNESLFKPRNGTDLLELIAGVNKEDSGDFISRAEEEGAQNILDENE